jgi:dienelactone hydrolase
MLTYPVDDGAIAHSWLFSPDGAEGRPAILVFPEAFGLGEHAKGRARWLSEMGYAALACDIFGGGRLIEAPAQTMAATAPYRTDRARILAHGKAGLAALAARREADMSRAAAIGFCFGGLFAIELARSNADVQAVIGFHGGLANEDPRPVEPIAAKVLVCLGADDPAIPPPQRVAFEAEMRQAGASWELQLFGGVVHGFTNPDADRLGMPDIVRYDATADRQSWAAMRSLFAETIDRQ